MTKAQISGRLGGLVTSMRHDPHEYTAAGLRSANSVSTWELRVDPEGQLPEAERRRRALAAYTEQKVRAANKRWGRG